MPDSLADDLIFRCSPDVYSRVLDGEAVLLDSTSGRYFGLNSSGARIWELLQAGKSAGAIRAALVSEFQVDATQAAEDLAALVRELEARALVHRGP